ncbi:MAG: hypothetical protein JXX14_11270 [Deltaproteobacteria bacterium]|nr:hypothetical protein [Deltaproteobacteria bacterium]
MKRCVLLCVLFLACAACDSLDDLTTQDVITNGGTDSHVDTATDTATIPIMDTSSEGTTTWPNCEEALYASIDGSMSPGDACTFNNQECGNESGQIRCENGVLWLKCQRDNDRDGEIWMKDRSQFEACTWLVYCSLALDGWITGDVWPSDACYWSKDEWCADNTHGEVHCVSGSMQMFCYDNSDKVLTNYNDRCNWYVPDTDTGSDSDAGNGTGWTDCSAAAVAWENGTALPGDACDFAGSMCGTMDGNVYCVDGKLRINCGPDSDVNSPLALIDSDDACSTDTDNPIWYDCQEAFSAWIDGRDVNGMTCYWDFNQPNYVSVCGEDTAGYISCQDTQVKVACGADTDTASPFFLEAGEQCGWQTGNPDIDIIYTDCADAYYRWIIGEAALGSKCTFEGERCGEEGQQLHCQSNRLFATCPNTVDPAYTGDFCIFIE